MRTPESIAGRRNGSGARETGAPKERQGRRGERNRRGS
jgi:hypothetical protein